MDVMAMDQAAARLSPINFEPLHERVYRELRRVVPGPEWCTHNET